VDTRAHALAQGEAAGVVQVGGCALLAERGAEAGPVWVSWLNTTFMT